MNVVTSLRTKNVHKSTLISHPRTPFWVTVYMASVNGPETKVIYAIVWSTQCFTIVLCNKHCKLVLTVFHNINYKLKAVLHARVVKLACCRIVGLNQNRRVISTLILLLFMSGICAMRSMDVRYPGSIELVIKEQISKSVITMACASHTGWL